MSTAKPKHSKEEAELLKGHRERLRNRYISQDTDYLNDARLLELMLTYAFAQKDVYPLALKLLAKFGNIDNVLSASIDELRAVEGIGKSSAILINMHQTLMRRCIIAQNSLETFNDHDELAKKICTLFYGIKGEKLMVMTFDSSMRLLNYEWLSTERPLECYCKSRDLAKIILHNGVSKVAIAHNHPNGCVSPSGEDIRAAMILSEIIRSLEVELVDIFIVSGDKYYKMSEATHHVGDFRPGMDDTYSSVFDQSEDCQEYPEFVETIIKENGE